MRLRKIGDYQYKGEHGLYAQVVGAVPEGYTAIAWACLPDEQFPAIRRGEVFEVADEIMRGSIYPRIDQCLGD